MLELPNYDQPPSSSPPRAFRRNRGRHPRKRHLDRCRRGSSGLALPLVSDLLRLVPSARRVGQRPCGIAHRRPHSRRRGQSHPAVRRGHSRQRSRRRQCAALRAAQRRPCQPDRGRARAAIGAVGLRSDRRRGRGRRRGAGQRRHARAWSKAAASAPGAPPRGPRSATAERGVSLGIRRPAQRRHRQLSPATASATAIATCRARRRAPIAWRPPCSSAHRGSRYAARASSTAIDPLTFARADTARRDAQQAWLPGGCSPTIGERDAIYGLRLGQPARLAQPQLCRRRSRSTARAPAAARWRSRPATRFGQAPLRRRGRKRARGVSKRATLLYGGFTDQDRARDHHSLTLEWKMSDLGPLVDRLRHAPRHLLALQGRDDAARIGGGRPRTRIFARRNLWRGHCPAELFRSLRLFPGSFVGNPDLQPEKSRGGEVSLRYRCATRSAGALTYYPPAAAGRDRRRLRFPFVDHCQRRRQQPPPGHRSRKSIIAPSAALRLTGDLRLPRRQRTHASAAPRSRSSAAPDIAAASPSTAPRGRLSYGVAIAYTGDADRHRLRRLSGAAGAPGPYWLASARLAYRVIDRSKHLSASPMPSTTDYQDVVGYRTEGRSVHAGIRVALGR